MKTSIYIGNEKLQMAYGESKDGKISIVSYGEVSIPEGTTLNGVIINDDQFRNTFRTLMTEHADVQDCDLDIIVGGDQIKTRIVDAPKLSETDMMGWVKDEFDDRDTDEEMLYDYRILKTTDEGCTALICASTKKMVEDYIEIMEDAGMKIASITNSLDAKMRLLSHMPQTAESDFIFVNIDGNNLYSQIFIDGQFRISNDVRLFSERGSAQVEDEIEQAISASMQFAHTEGYAERIGKIYLCGTREDEYFVFGGIENTFSLPVALLVDSGNIIEVSENYTGDVYKLSDYIYTTGGLITLKNRMINFYRQYSYDPEAAKKRRSVIKFVLPLAIMLVIVLGLFAYLKISDVFMNREISQINDYINSESTQSNYNEALALQTQQDELANMSAMIESAIEEMQMYRKVDSGLVNDISRALSGGHMDSCTYSSESSSIVIVASSDTASSLPQFVKNLKGINSFSNVSYYGYEESDGGYQTTFTCVMR